MALVLNLPDDLVLNYVLLYVGSVKEILILREVSKSFNEKIEILLLAIIELDLIHLDNIKADFLFSSNKVILEDLEDLKKMQIFRLKNLTCNDVIDNFDLLVAQGLMCLSRNFGIEENFEEIEYFLRHTMTVELKQIFKFNCSREMLRKASEMCLLALAVPIVVNEKQRKLLNWLTGALKMIEIYFNLEPNFAKLIKTKQEYDFHVKRVTQISRYFGMSQSIA